LPERPGLEIFFEIDDAYGHVAAQTRGVRAH
jgi:hypothetical protein